ncbi:N-acyl-D-amino-acid deacylase family protein [Archangium lansingense]|uniref:N-acyl-D-amino-acid deacylase family protein n=1 Tax=Archangium lansingense TaxID=2995310 RepID=UPI003B7DB074
MAPSHPTIRRQATSTASAPLTRRTVLGSALGLAGASALGCAGRGQRPGAGQTYDVLVQGGTVYDGTGAPGVAADIGIAGGRIVAIGALAGAGASTLIDARGLAVAPGFIDFHSHTDGTLFDDPNAESVLRQGVTTVVTGQDGYSRAPRLRASVAEGGSDRFESMDAFFEAIERLSPAVNVANMVGLGSVRKAVIGEENRPATPEELARMVALVEAALAEGACGASSGLEYTPGAFASLEELIALCRPLGARGLVYATHIRNEDEQLVEAIDEAIAVARGAGCPLHISHLKTSGRRNWSKLDQIFARLERARTEERVDLSFDRYPYTAYQTTLTNLFPAWSRDGGADAFLARLSEPGMGERLREAAMAKVESIGGWDNVMVSAVAHAADRAAEGQRLGSYAAALGTSPYEAAVGLLQRSRGNVGMVGFAMSEDNLVRIISHPLWMAASDGSAMALEGPARRGHPHPRSLGTFSRVLGVYVREKKVLTLEQAIHKLSGFPAARARLKDRGLLAPGMAADVVVFDPASVADQATYAQPFAYATGVRAVLVNGALALLDGERGPQRAGRPLRVTAA